MIAGVLGLTAATAASVKFITLGDWGGKALGGYHATDVDAVASAMGTCATSNPIDFLINTGDNFYYCGIQNTSDFQIATDFTGPYSASVLNVNWYGVLGNHEYGYNVQAQLDLAKLDLKPKWVRGPSALLACMAPPHLPCRACSPMAVTAGDG